MADALPESALRELDDPFAELTGPLASTIRLDFEVVDSARLTPHMQRLRLTAAQLDGFGYLPGQDVMLLVAAEGNRPVRRQDRGHRAAREDHRLGHGRLAPVHGR